MDGVQALAAPIFIFNAGQDGSAGTNAFLSARQVVSIAQGFPGTMLRVTFQAAAGSPGSAVHCSLGIWNGSNYDMTGAPAILTFGGNPGFTMAAGARVTSDWVLLPGFSPTTGSLVIVMENASSQANTLGFVSAVGGASAGLYSTSTYNVGAPGTTGQTNTFAGMLIAVTTIESMTPGMGPGGQPVPASLRPISITNLLTGEVIGFDTISDVLLGNPFFTFANYDPATYEVRNNSGSPLTVSVGRKNYTVASGVLWTFNLNPEVGPLVGWRYVSGTRVYG